MSIDTHPSRRQVRTEARVIAAYDVTPRMRRVVFGGGTLRALLELASTDSAAAWVKVFVPGREGRAYTIRRIDRSTGELHIDFVLHGAEGDDGSVSAWARSAQTGEVVGIAGPRNGGFTLQPDACWVWLAGDACALPAMQSILERLPIGISAHVHIEVEDEAERQPLRTPAVLHETWDYSVQLRGSPDKDTATILSRLNYPEGLGQVWVAGEAAMVKAIRWHWLQERGVEGGYVSTKGYWKFGERNHRD